MDTVSTKSTPSILKPYSSKKRDSVKLAVLNKVRFNVALQYPVDKIIKDIRAGEDTKSYIEFLEYLEVGVKDESQLVEIFNNTRKYIHLLRPSTHGILVNRLISQNGLEGSDELVQSYKLLLIDLVSTYTAYVNVVIDKLITHWIPLETDASHWNLGIPSAEKQKLCMNVSNILSAFFDIIPLSYDIIIDTVAALYPYHTKPSYIVGGYAYNIFMFIQYHNVFKDSMIRLILRKIVLLDVNAPRNIIEDCESDDSDIDDDEDMTTVKYTKNMVNNIADTLDICMMHFLNYIDEEYKTFTESATAAKEHENMFNYLIQLFDEYILPTHKTHHVQFIIFYLCSLKASMADKFLNILWHKICNPNLAPNIRQSAVGYIASILARAKYLSIVTIKSILKELCSWAHQYIQKSDSIQCSPTLRAHLVFYSVCQAIFYIVAFRSKDLTNSKKNLLFLQSLQLSALVTSQLNPLRVCLPAVATTFAGVTRAHQLAYCHTVLERNARHKLGTLYSNSVFIYNEILETYFPFDPYLLKKSSKYIDNIFLEYIPSDAEEFVFSNKSGSVTLSSPKTELSLRQNYLDFTENNNLTSNQNTENNFNNDKTTNGLLKHKNNSAINNNKHALDYDEIDDFIIDNKKLRISIE